MTEEKKKEKKLTISNIEILYLAGIGEYLFLVNSNYCIFSLKVYFGCLTRNDAVQSSLSGYNLIAGEFIGKLFLRILARITRDFANFGKQSSAAARLLNMDFLTR